MLDYLDSRVEPDKRLYPVAEPARRRAMKVASLATALGEQGVSLFYEQRLHKEVSEVFTSRRRMQMAGVLAALEADRAARPGAYWFGDGIGHADIAVAAALRFLSEALRDVVVLADHPALSSHCARLEALPVFQRISQPFIAPA